MNQSTNKLTNGFYTILSLPATAMGFALSIQIAVLSWILRTKYELDIHQIGWVWLAGPLAGIIGQLSVGYISDKVWFWNGRRRPFIWIGGITAAGMLFLLPRLDFVASFFGIANIMIIALVVALLLDLAINISFNPTRSLIADVTPAGDARTKGYTWMQTISGFFGVVAYFIGAYISNYFLIYFGIGIILVFSLLPPLFINEPRQLADQSDNQKVSTGTIDKRKLWHIYFANGFTWLGVQTMFVYIFAFLEQRFAFLDDNAIGTTIGYAFLVMNFVGFLLPKFVLEPMAQKLGRIRVHFMSLAVMALGFLAIVYFAHSVAMLYFIMAFVGIGWAATVSLPFAIFTDNVSGNKMGFYMGIFNLSIVIPQIIVSGAFGLWIKNTADKAMVFWIAGVCLAIAALLWRLLVSKKKV